MAKAKKAKQKQDGAVAKSVPATIPEETEHELAQNSPAKMGKALHNDGGMMALGESWFWSLLFRRCQCLKSMIRIRRLTLCSAC